MNHAITSTWSHAHGSSTISGKIETLLEAAGIRVNGSRPWDMRIHSADVWNRMVSKGSLGLGEAYMDGDWDAERLDEFFERVLRAKLDQQVRPLRLLVPILRDRLFNRQNTRRAWHVGRVHYDLGNDFYQEMLDPRMTYSCGYWDRADNLAEAQEAKLDLICRKLRLEPGMRVLDIGCGWGSFMAYAAEHYGVECVGITISSQQAEFIKNRYPNLPLEVRLQDYRQLHERFDCIASVGMFEHVGTMNSRNFMKIAHRCLVDDGLFLLHTIGKSERGARSDPWIEKYIFPNGEIPALAHVGEALEGWFVVEDLHNFGADYDKTLMAWHENFESAWPGFAQRFGERFYRQWRYYLLSCAGAFRARDLQVWQWTLSKQGIRGGCSRVS